MTATIEDVTRLAREAEDMSLTQTERALAKANMIRFQRAILRRQIGEGLLKPSALIRRNPPSCATMELYRLLTPLHRWGQRRAEIHGAKIGIKMNWPLARLTDRQREALATLLEEQGL